MSNKKNKTSTIIDNINKDIISDLDKTDSTTSGYLEKSVELLRMFVNENERLQEEAYGYKFVADEEKKYTNKLTNYVDNLKSENDKLNCQLNNFEKQAGGVNNDIINIFKSYSKELSESRKKEIENKYRQYISSQKINL